MDCEKITYQSYNEAQEAIAHLARMQGRSMRVYKCTDCGGLHIATIRGHKYKMGSNYGKEKYPFKMDLKPVKGKREPKIKKEPYQEKKQALSKYKLLSKEMAEQLKQKLNLDNDILKQLKPTKYQTMRHIVDLEGRLVVINWWEGNNISPEKELRYRELYKKKERTKTETQEMEELAMVEGDVVVRTGIIKIIDTDPIDVNIVKPTFEISQWQWAEINDAIAKLSESYKGKKIRLQEAMSFLNKE